MTTSVEQSLESRSGKVIVGYELIERIGNGGYGEVWRAKAPGGIDKAIKFIYGTMDDDRAGRELKSLNRIKEVHHPFLLSLERIEVVDSQLVIVTELADCSLKDRFVECQQEGSVGIPREELLDYLRDTADALDYLYEKHGLQHLDIKPDNLLLQGNHVKVADFGLLKDLTETGVSLMGGMTPLYSAPELFDGRPSQYTDQYSLAVVYQEMLTGEPPFQGRTTAQLAAQHLRSQPRLDPLPNSDHYAVSRALSKDPKTRFPRCRAFVERLINPYNPTRNKSIRTQTTARQTGETKQSEGIDLIEQTAVISNQSSKVVKLSRFDLDLEAITYRPVVFVGIGGTAGKVLAKLTGRLNDRFGNLSEIPAIQTVLLDTDIQALTDLTRDEAAHAIRAADTLAMPLRQAKDYREDSKRLLEWMSRRWLYNIPRSMQTDGMRPLGRLAFVDHFDQINDRLRKAITTAVDPNSIKASSEYAKIEFAETDPQVVYIASTSGGTGSGIVLDLGFTIQTLLSDLNMSESATCGMLLHSTSRKTSEYDLAVANTYALLNELKHFHSPFGYPGDPACGLPHVTSDVGLAKTVYFLHLGDRLSEDQYDQSVQQVAEYLYRGTATAASSFVECTRGDGDDPARMEVRTSGLATTGVSESGILHCEANAVCRTILRKWSTGSYEEPDQQQLPFGNQRNKIAEPTDPELDSRCDKFALALKLDMETLLEIGTNKVQQQMGCDVDAYLRRVAASFGLTDEHAVSNSACGEDAVAAIDEFFGEVSMPGTGDAAFLPVAEKLNEHLRDVVAEKFDAINQLIVDTISTHPLHIQGGKLVVGRMISHCKYLDQIASHLVQALDYEFESVMDGLLNPEEDAEESPVARMQRNLLKYCQLCLQRILYRSARKAISRLSSLLNVAEESLQELRRTLGAIATKFASQETTGSAKAIAGELESEREKLAGQVEAALQDSFFNDEHTLHSVFSGTAGVHQALVTAMKATAQQVVLRAIGNVCQEHALLAQSREEQKQVAEEFVDKAVPKLLCCGGGQRLLLITSENEQRAQFQDLIEIEAECEATFIPGSDGDTVLVCEGESLSIERVARSIVGNRGDYIEIASRLHTRIDVPWMS